MRNRLALLLLAGAGWAARPAKPNPRVAAMAALAEQVMRDGEGAVIDAPVSGYVNVDNPTSCKVVHWRDATDNLSHSVMVAINPGTKPGEVKPQFMFFVTRQIVPGVEERRYLRVSLTGQLEQVTAIRDRLDARGLPMLDGREVFNVNVGEKRAKDWFAHEEEFYFKGKYRRRKP